MKTKYNILTFILITFGFTWLFWVPDALIAQNLWDAPEFVRSFLALNLGAWGPLVGAILTTFIYQKGAGVKDLLRRGLMVRLGKWWWVTLLIFPVLIGGALGLYILFGGAVPEFEALAEPIALPIALVFIFFNGGPLQEEFGWRGYAFEHLQKKFSALTAAIIVGLMWSTWHLPLYFVPRSDAYYNNPIWGIFLTLVLVGIIMAWIYVNTKGSIFATMLAHAMFNWSNWVFPVLKSDSAGLILFGLYFLVVVYIIWRYGWKKLERE